MLTFFVYCVIIVTMQILDTEQCKEWYKKCISTAERFLIIASPYYDFGDNLNLNEININNPKLKFAFFVRHEPSLTNKDYQILSDKVVELKYENVFFKRILYLHAKCVINEKFAVMGSLNFTEKSLNQKNIESGMLFFSNENKRFCMKKSEDAKCYKELCLYLASTYNQQAKNIWNQYKLEFTQENDLRKCYNFLNKNYKEEILFPINAKFTIKKNSIVPEKS